MIFYFTELARPISTIFLFYFPFIPSTEMIYHLPPAWYKAPRLSGRARAGQVRRLRPPLSTPAVASVHLGNGG